MRTPLLSRALIVTSSAALAATVAVVSAQAPQTPQPPPGGRGGTPQTRGLPPMGAGPKDVPLVEIESAERGKSVWAAQCINCHGTGARGTENGSNLVRSTIVLRDRYGSQLGPYLKKGHKMQSGASGATLTDEQIRDLANFLRDRVNDSLRGSPLFQARNVLIGDPKAGAEYFNGAGKCATCHSPTTAPLAGIGSRLEPIDIQQRFLFPGGGRGGRGGARGGGPSPASAVRVTVTPAAGETVTGTLVAMDDFNVTLRDASGGYRTIRRGPAVKVVKDDPLAAHHALLDTITDKQMHDVVAYLETLK